MPLTRREFSTVATGSLALIVLGETACGDNNPPPTATPMDRDQDRQKNKANRATEPFVIGPASKYKEKGLYQDFKKDKGVWIVSDGKVLVALDATCTHQGCTTNWMDDQKAFVCPCHKSHFDLEGINTEGKAKRPMERCALKVTKNAAGENTVEVDPTHRFRKDKDEWTDPASSLPLEG